MIARARRWWPAAKAQSSKARVARLQIAKIMVAVLFAALSKPAAADTQLLLEVVINGYTTGKIGSFVQREGGLWAAPGELRELGLRAPGAAAGAAAELVALASLPGVSARLDGPTQKLYLTAAPASLLPSFLNAGGDHAEVPFASGTGALVNYDLVDTAVGGEHSTAGLFEARAFSPWGVVASGVLANFNSAERARRGQPETVRLDTSYTFSDPHILRRYRLGDFIAGGLGWTRPQRMGGARVSSDFSMRPDLVTSPQPGLSGSATVPSTVDVLVDGQRVLSREVPPGPFAVPQLPVISGANSITLIVTDALGRQQVQTLPFYASSNLLAPGLQTYAVAAGALRRNWGSVSDDYGDAATVASYRRGLSERVTLEAHGEGAAELAMGGGGLVVKVGDLGVVDLAVAASGGGGGEGALVALGAQRLGRRFSWSASATLADAGFSDLGVLDGDPRPRRRLFASAGLALGTAGSINLAYVGLDGGRRPRAGGLFGDSGLVRAAEHQRLLSASYSVSLPRRMSLFVTAFRDMTGASGGNGAMLGVTLPLGRGSASVSSSSGGDTGSHTQVQAAQGADTVGDWGYLAYHANGPAGRDIGELSYKSRWALVALGADQGAGETALRAQARGALAYAAGGVFATNYIDDSFAVVDTEGAAGIRVRYENRDMGRTDRGGRLLVPELRAFEINRVAIEPTDVPPDATVTLTERLVRPLDQVGVVVKFPIRASRGALLRLVDATGAPLPLGSVVTLAASGATAPVGYDGEAYLEDLDPENTLRVQRPDGSQCAAEFAYRPVPGDIPTIGPLRCMEQSP